MFARIAVISSMSCVQSKTPTHQLPARNAPAMPLKGRYLSFLLTAAVKSLPATAAATDVLDARVVAALRAVINHLVQA
jgi:hypothetical protein